MQEPYAPYASSHGLVPLTSGTYLNATSGPAVNVTHQVRLLCSCPRTFGRSGVALVPTCPKCGGIMVPCKQGRPGRHPTSECVQAYLSTNVNVWGSSSAHFWCAVAHLLPCLHLQRVQHSVCA